MTHYSKIFRCNISNKSSYILDNKAKGYASIIKLGINSDLIQMKKNQALSWIGSDISKLWILILTMNMFMGSKSLLFWLEYMVTVMICRPCECGVGRKIAEEQGKLLYYKDKFVIADRISSNK